MTKDPSNRRTAAPRLLPVLLFPGVLLLLAALLNSGEPAAAGESTDSDPAFAAIGRLNAAGYRNRRHCSAVLVAPDRALTARHCLKRFFHADDLAPDALHLLLGYARGDWVDYRRVVGFIVPEGYPEDADIVVLRLESPSSVTPIPVRPEPPRAGETVIQAGYRADRAHLLTIEHGCRLLQPLRGHRWTHDCDTVQGDSGGPLMVRTADGYRVVGIQSRTADRFGIAEDATRCGAACGP